CCVSVFFFQAEDGIRDDLVTGVQTCALPISVALPERSSLGMMRSTSTRTVSHSWAVNAFGSYVVPRASASRARADASRTDSGVHRKAAASGATARVRTASRRFIRAPLSSFDQ